MCSVSKEQLLGWAQITMGKHLWFIAVWDGTVLATPKLKWFPNVFSVDYKVANMKKSSPRLFYFILFCVYFAFL